MSTVQEKDVKHLAELARINLTSTEEVALTHDLESILEHFKELEAVKTEGVMPVNGGTELKNVLREDVAYSADAHTLRRALSKEEKGFLKVPGVFEE